MNFIREYKDPEDAKKEAASPWGFDEDFDFENIVAFD